MSINVLNGNGVDGLGSNAAYELGQHGYQIVVPANPADRNAPNFKYFHTQVYYDKRQSGREARRAQGRESLRRRDAAAAAGATQGEGAGRDGDGHRRIDVPRDARAGAGRQDAEEAARVRPQPIPRRPSRCCERAQKGGLPTDGAEGRRALVVHRPRHADPRLRHLEGRARGAPDVPDSQNFSGYWGIEETSWNDAPVLDQPNFKHVIKGREYYFYYSGAHLHMVVLKTRKASYWVINTLDDSLSNETMIEIAKGLKPLARRLRPMSRIAIFGAGYVGLVTGACFAELGHEVVVRDIVPEKIDALRRGEVPIHEPGLEELLVRNAERLRYTLDVREALDDAEFVFICVDTPPLYSGDADLSRVWTVVDELPEDTRATIVMKSTVPVGTGEKVRAALDSRGLPSVGYVSNPEFTAEGTAVRDFMQPDRVVIGAFDDGDGDAVEALHAGIDAPIVRADVNSAEMIKLAANAFLMTRVSFINEIANVCELVGADVQSVAEGIGLDHRLGPHFLRAGMGYGGSCFPKDSLALKQLAANSGYHFQLLTAVIEVNELQKRRVIQKLQKHLGRLRGKTIALLGLAFKPNTDDMREAPSLVLASRLLAEGAEVRAWDPIARVELRGVSRHETPLEAVTGADAAVIVTEWPELKELASEEIRAAMAHPLIIDGRNLLDPAAVRAAGFAYEGIGRAVSALDVFPETPEREPEPSA